jgi:hypothetical protein
MIIFYAKSSDGPGERLLQAVTTTVSGANLEICRNSDALLIALCRPGSAQPIAILLASNNKELLEVFSLRELLWDVRVILALPDSDPETVSRGHLLRPRFMTDCAGDFQEVAAVLGRMIGNEVSGMNPPITPG